MTICAFMCYFFLIFLKYRQHEIAIGRVVTNFPSLISEEFLRYIQDELRRRHYNATQKLRTSNPTELGGEKTRLEQEVLLCGSGKSVLKPILHSICAF